jgi:hypothetical protein
MQGVPEPDYHYVSEYSALVCYRLTRPGAPSSYRPRSGAWSTVSVSCGSCWSARRDTWCSRKAGLSRCHRSALWAAELSTPQSVGVVRIIRPGVRGPRSKMRMSDMIRNGRRTVELSRTGSKVLLLMWAILGGACGTNERPGLAPQAGGAASAGSPSASSGASPASSGSGGTTASQETGGNVDRAGSAGLDSWVTSAGQTGSGTSASGGRSGWQWRKRRSRRNRRHLDRWCCGRGRDRRSERRPGRWRGGH